MSIHIYINAIAPKTHFMNFNQMHFKQPNNQSTNKGTADPKLNFNGEGEKKGFDTFISGNTTNQLACVHWQCVSELWKLLLLPLLPWQPLGKAGHAR